MKIALKKEIQEKISEVLEEIKKLGFQPETLMELENLDITLMGGSKDFLILPKIIFTFYIPDSMLEMKE